MNVFIISTFMIIPLLIGIIILIFEKKININEITKIKIFTSLIFLITSIYSFCFYCIQSSNVENEIIHSTIIPILAQKHIIFDIKNYLNINNYNVIILIAISIISFCTDLFPDKIINKKQTAYTQFFKFGIYGCIISDNIFLFSFFIITASLYFYLILFKKKDRNKIITPSISIIITLVILLLEDFKLIQNIFIIFPILFITSLILSGFPYTDKWLTEHQLNNGNEIFTLTIFGKCGILIFFKYTIIICLNSINFYLPFIIISGIIFATIKTIQSMTEKNFQKICINYLAINSAIMIISTDTLSNLTFMCIIFSIFTGLITQTGLLFCSTLISIKSQKSENIFINKDNLFFRAMLIINCLSALFIPGTANFIPYIFMLELATQNSALTLLFLLIYPISSEIYLYKKLQPILQKDKNQIDLQTITIYEQTGLIIMNFVIIAIGILPAIILQPIVLIKMFIN